jgi:hypothetical protein
MKKAGYAICDTYGINCCFYSTFYTPLCLCALVTAWLFEKTNPIFSYCVLRAVYCDKEAEKTKPICLAMPGNPKF